MFGQQAFTRGAKGYNWYYKGLAKAQAEKEAAATYKEFADWPPAPAQPRTRTFFDISIDSKPSGKLVFELAVCDHRVLNCCSVALMCILPD